MLPSSSESRSTARVFSAWQRNQPKTPSTAWGHPNAWDDERSSTIQYIDTPNIYLIQCRYVYIYIDMLNTCIDLNIFIFTIIYSIVPALLISCYIILCKYHVSKNTRYFAINPSRLYKSGKVSNLVEPIVAVAEFMSKSQKNS